MTREQAKEPTPVNPGRQQAKQYTPTHSKDDTTQHPVKHPLHPQPDHTNTHTENPYTIPRDRILPYPTYTHPYTHCTTHFQGTQPNTQQTHRYPHQNPSLPRMQNPYQNQPTLQYKCTTNYTQPLRIPREPTREHMHQHPTLLFLHQHLT